MVVERGEIWWVDLGEPIGSAQGYRRPVVVATVSSNLALVRAPGNFALTKRSFGLDRESVVIVSQLVTIDRTALDTRAGHLSAGEMRELERGLRLVLDLAS